MTEKRKTWLQDNFLSLVIIAMITAFFVYNLDDRQSNAAEHHTFQKDITDLKSITFNLVEAYGGKMAKDQEQDQKLSKQDEEILELWKCNRRSGNSNQTILK